MEEPECTVPNAPKLLCTCPALTMLVFFSLQKQSPAFGEFTTSLCICEHEDVNRFHFILQAGLAQGSPRAERAAVRGDDDQAAGHRRRDHTPSSAHLPAPLDGEPQLCRPLGRCTPALPCSCNLVCLLQAHCTLPHPAKLGTIGSLDFPHL